MSRNSDDGQHEHHDDQGDLEDDDDLDPGPYTTLVELERLESLEEEMQELGVTSLDDIRRRIDELNAQLDEGPDAQPE
jgi:hypothetical protein